ncbi:MAG: hypothetical protein KO316_01360 [Methanobacterium sp.]|nr:hypothetical protein [Methanobacterium sp.]
MEFKNSLIKHQHYCGDDKFRGVWENVNGRVQIKYAEKIGLGTQNYNLISL